MPEPSETDLAYLAGMVDADGYITIQRSKHKDRLYHAPKLGITGTRREPHDLAASFWGGGISVTYPKNKDHKPCFLWSRTGLVAMRIIEAIEPFVRVKRAQVLLSYDLWEHLELGRGEDPFPCFGPNYDPVPTRDEMWAQMVVLNDSRNRLRTRNAQVLLGLC